MTARRPLAWMMPMLSRIRSPASYHSSARNCERVLYVANDSEIAGAISAASGVSRKRATRGGRVVEFSDRTKQSYT